MKNNYNKVCITGSQGFIGNHLFDDSKKDGVNCFQWNRLRPNDFGQSSILIHLAARVHQMRDNSENPLNKFRDTNRDLTISLARQVLKNNIKKFVFISTVKVIGEKPGSYDLTSPCIPKDPYGISKWEAEHELKKIFSKQKNTQCIILRLPMVYGENNKGNILSLLNTASKKISLPLLSVKGKRSAIYVKNVTSAILDIIQDDKNSRPAVQTYFLSDSLDLTSGELYSKIFRNMHQRNGVFHLPEQLFRIGGFCGSALKKSLKINLPISNEVVSRLFDEFRFSSKEFCQDYNWSPPFTPDEGIKNTVNWYLNERFAETR